MISRQGRNRKILFTGDYEGKILNKIYVFSIPVCLAPPCTKLLIEMIFLPLKNFHPREVMSTQTLSPSCVFFFKVL